MADTWLEYIPVPHEVMMPHEGKTHRASTHDATLANTPASAVILTRRLARLTRCLTVHFAVSLSAAVSRVATRPRLARLGSAARVATFHSVR